MRTEEQPGHKVKLDVSVSAESSIIGSGGFNFGGLGLQGQSDGSSARNIFEGSCTEEGTEA